MVVSHYLATLQPLLVGLLVPSVRLMRKFVDERVLLSNCDQVLFKSLKVLTRPVLFSPRTSISYREQHMQTYLPGKYTEKLRYPSGKTYV